MATKFFIFLLALLLLGSSALQTPQANAARSTNRKAMLSVCAGPMALDVLPKTGGPILIRFGAGECRGDNGLYLQVQPFGNAGRKAARPMPVRLHAVYESGVSAAPNSSAI